VRPADTSPEAWKLFLELHRNKPPGEKLRQVLDYSWFLFQMTESVIRAEHPEWTEREVFLRAASQRLDAETMKAVYGWDPTADRHAA
jgi:hypothetical protein